MKPAIEAKERGWTQNSRGGWQPPDHEIDTVDIPALSTDAKTIHRGPISEFLKRRREQSQGITHHTTNQSDISLIAAAWRSRCEV